MTEARGIRKRNAIRQAKNDEDKAAATLDQVRLNAMREIVSAQIALRTSLAANDAALVLKAAAQTSYDAMLDSYKQGVGTVTATVDAEAHLFQAELAVDDEQEFKFFSRHPFTAAAKVDSLIEKMSDSLCEDILRAQLALPENQTLPAYAPKSAKVSRITFFVSGNLLPPIFQSRLRHSPKSTVVSMPEASMDEYSLLSRRENQIWNTW